MKTKNVKNQPLLIFLLRQSIRINSGRNYSLLIRLLFASVLVLSAFGRQGCFAQNIGINTAGASPHASAILDIDVAPGNDKGLLVPRMTTVQRNAIVAPAHSLLIYNITTDCFEAWNQNTLMWVAFGCIGCQLPGTFSALVASGIAGTSFSANWNGSVGASAYFLDVSTDVGFSSFVAGYNNLNVGNVVTSSVTGLTCGTYYYRVRANNACGTSANSNTITASTNPSVPPAQPSVITGTSPVCQGNNGIAYSVTNVGGVTYTWTYSGTGYTQATGGTTNSITANFSGAATSGTLTVTPGDACGTGTARTFAITVTAAPTVSAANTDQTICATTATLAGNTPTVGTGLWTLVSGAGTITTPTSATSGLTALGVGANTFRWTISNSPCMASTDDVIITRSATPTVSAANIDQTICATTATLAGNAPTVGTGLWMLISGAGTITTPTSPTSGLTALGVGANTFRWTISNAPCTASTDDLIITRTAAPTTAAAGIDINPACGVTTATLAGNTATVGTGAWSVVSGTATITTSSSPTSGVTGLAVPGTATLRWTISNAPCTASTDDVVITTIACCGGALAINHTIGTIAPETKSVNYGTVTTSLSGASKCWITQNLGSTNQAGSATDATDASAGWYWQFNRKQGYKVGPTPAWTITAINEASDWLAANDPCTIELGAGWRIPTNTEWTNADANGPWANYTDAYNSVLKLHAAGYLTATAGALGSRGISGSGSYWSSTQSSTTNGWYLIFNSGISTMNSLNKSYGFSLRCLRD
ncbi:MAG: hypothetical protein V4549_20080 [Bacteroidota bacterium]